MYTMYTTGGTAHARVPLNDVVTINVPVSSAPRVFLAKKKIYHADLSRVNYTKVEYVYGPVKGLTEAFLIYSWPFLSVMQLMS